MVELSPQLPLFPVDSCSIRVLVVNAVSPSSFYLKYPNENRKDAQLGPFEKPRSCHPNYLTFKANLAKFYDENPKRFLLSSLPAPGSLIVVEREKEWERGIALDEDDYSGEDVGGSEGDQRVLLVDEGQTTRVCINNIRYISNNLHSSSRDDA